jgi:hypothetical protein
MLDYWRQAVALTGSTDMLGRSAATRGCPTGGAARIAGASVPRAGAGLIDARGPAPVRRLEISFSQGAKWKALISKYIGTIPLSGDASCAAEQSISDGPPPRTPVSSAMIAKVGAAARHSQSAAARVAAFPLPSPALAVSRRAAIIVAVLEQSSSCRSSIF